MTTLFAAVHESAFDAVDGSSTRHVSAAAAYCNVPLHLA